MNSNHHHPAPTSSCFKGLKPKFLNASYPDAKTLTEAQDRTSHTTTSPMRRLPTELIAEILRWYLPQGGFLHLPLRKNRPNPLSFGFVCSRWRSVALSIASLWAHLHVAVPRLLDREEAERLADLTNFCIQLSGNRPIKFHLSAFPVLGIGETEPLHTTSGTPFRLILEPLFLRSRQWKEISMDITYPALQLLLSDDPHSPSNPFPPALQTPILESFQLADGFSLGDDILRGRHFLPSISLLNAPLLRKVVLNRIAVRDLAFPWEQVEELSLGGLDLNEGLAILRCCSGLKSCTLTATHNTGDYLEAPVVLEKLENLYVVENTELDGIADICHKLACPNLRNASFRSHVQSDEDIDVSSLFWMKECLKTFLSYSSKLTGLHMWNLPLNERGLLEVVKGVPNVTHLSTSSKGSLQSVGNQVLYELTLTLPLDGTETLRNLEYIHIESRVCADQFIAEFIDSRWVGQSKYTTGLKEIHLNLQGSKLGPEFHSRLAGLCEDGLKVVVVSS